MSTWQEILERDFRNIFRNHLNEYVRSGYKFPCRALILHPTESGNFKHNKTMSETMILPESFANLLSHTNPKAIDDLIDLHFGGIAETKEMKDKLRVFAVQSMLLYQTSLDEVNALCQAEADAHSVMAAFKSLPGWVTVKGTNGENVECYIKFYYNHSYDYRLGYFPFEQNQHLLQKGWAYMIENIDSDKTLLNAIKELRETLIKDGHEMWEDVSASAQQEMQSAVDSDKAIAAEAEANGKDAFSQFALDDKPLYIQQVDESTSLPGMSNEGKAIPHTVTEQDAANNPDLAAEGIQPGDQIDIPAEGIVPPSPSENPHNEVMDAAEGISIIENDSPESDTL
jgi:hypothetical protein